MLELTPVYKLSKDIMKASGTLSDEEARFLVKAYYMMQDNRIRSRGQERSLEKQEKPHEIITFFADQDELLEGQVKKALDAYTNNHVMGSWMRDIYGIGSVIAAGMLALIDIEKAPTVGHIWAFAGWAADNQKPWEKGKIKPFSTDFRTLCWKVGQSFLKFSGNEDCIYGKILLERRAYENPKNERLEYADQAAKKLKLVGKNTEAYKWYEKGMLPPGHMLNRACRYAVKIFLSHLHQVWYEKHFGVPAPKPFAISHLSHAHMIQPPNHQPLGGEPSAVRPSPKKLNDVAAKPPKKVKLSEATTTEAPKKRGRPKKAAGKASLDQAITKIAN